jgi:hypothetical protein
MLIRVGSTPPDDMIISLRLMPGKWRLHHVVVAHFAAAMAPPAKITAMLDATTMMPTAFVKAALMISETS